MLMYVSRTYLTSICLLTVVLTNPLANGEGVTSHQVQADHVAPLQQRVEALNQAIELRCGNDKEKLKAAKQNLAQTLDAWNQLEQPSDYNERQLHNWLTFSMRSMIQGRFFKIPDAPLFIKNEMNVSSSADAKLDSPEPTSEGDSVILNPKPTKRRVAKPIPKQQERSRWSQHPSSAPLDWNDPFESKSSSTDSIEDPFRNNESTKYKVQRPFIDNAVSVNHSELIAAIRGFNLEVRNVNRRLQRVNQLSVTHLLKIAEDLERLWNEKMFLSLYLDGLTDDARRIMPRPLSAALAQELVLRQAADLLSGDSLNSQTDRAALQGLNRKLSQYK